jgi:Fur family ferric uptake transcriptional regulator
MTHDLLDYPNRIRGNGYRVTSQRKAILDAICGFGRRAGVEEIYRRLQDQSLFLDRATLYRNLAFLERLRLVDATGKGKGRRYEIASVKPHHHLVCRKCGKEAALDPECVDRLRERIRRDHIFLIDEDHLTFYGLCSRCLSARTRKSDRADDVPR